MIETSLKSINEYCMSEDLKFNIQSLHKKNIAVIGFEIKVFIVNKYCRDWIWNKSLYCQ